MKLQWTQVTMNFVDKLVALTGKSQAQIASDTGINKVKLSKFRNGKQDFHISDLLAIHNKYNCSIDYLLGITDIPFPNAKDDMDTSDKVSTLADFAKYFFYICENEDITVNPDAGSITFNNEALKGFIHEYYDVLRIPNMPEFDKNFRESFYDIWKQAKLNNNTNYKDVIEAVY